MKTKQSTQDKASACKIGIQRVGEDRRTLMFLGWVDREKRDVFYAKADDSGTVSRIRMEVVKPLSWSRHDSTSPGWVDSFYQENPIPDRQLVEIVPCRLLPPPCRKDAAESDMNDHFNHFEPWEIVYGYCLHLSDSDEKPLRKEWKKFTEQKTKERDRRIEYVSGMTLEKYKRHFGKASKKADLEKWKKQQSAVIEEIYEPIAPFRNPYLDDDFEVAGCLNFSFDMVKGNAGGIRDRYLQEKWADENGVDLRELERERTRLRRAIQRQAVNAEYRVKDLSRKESRIELGLDMYEDDWKATFASVRYRATFDGGSCVYLVDWVETECLTHDELQKLEGREQKPEIVFSDNFTHIQCPFIKTFPKMRKSKKSRILGELYQRHKTSPDTYHDYNELRSFVGLSTNPSADSDPRRLFRDPHRFKKRKEYEIVFGEILNSIPKPGNSDEYLVKLDTRYRYTVAN